MGDAEGERLIGIATRLFAELGYDGTPMRVIADAGGVDVPTLVARVGDKTRLYREVMLRAHRAEWAAMEAAVASFVPSQQGLIDLADAYLDFYLANPQVPGLWLHRWLGDAADVPGLEQIYSRPLTQLVAEAAKDVVPLGIDVDHLIWTIVWCVYGFLSGGLQHLDPRLPQGRGQYLTPGAVRRFRPYLHALIIHVTTPLPRKKPEETG